MQVVIHVEEPSMEAALSNIVPKILGKGAVFSVHPYGGKKAMLTRLPNRLRGYAKSIKDDPKCLLVLIDRDNDDCKALKERLDAMAKEAGLTSKSVSNIGFQIVNRIVIEELEAWFFGDIAAIRQVYPKVDANLGKKFSYRDPDCIKGGTWEALERVLQKAGYHPAGLPKIEVARAVSAHMVPARNTSKSFKSFVEGLQAAAGVK